MFGASDQLSVYIYGYTNYFDSDIYWVWNIALRR